MSVVQRLQAGGPVARPPMLMHYGRDEDPIRLHFVENRERKTGNEPLTNVCSVDWAGSRELSDALSCFFDC